MPTSAVSWAHTNMGGKHSPILKYLLLHFNCHLSHMRKRESRTYWVKSRKNWNGGLSQASHLGVGKTQDKTEERSIQAAMHSSHKNTKTCAFFCLFVFFTHYFDLEIENKRHKQLNESRKCQRLFQHTVIHCKHLQVANALRTTCYSCWKFAGNIFPHKVTMHAQSKSTVFSKEHRIIVLLTQFWITRQADKRYLCQLLLPRPCTQPAEQAGPKQYGTQQARTSAGMNGECIGKEEHSLSSIHEPKMSLLQFYDSKWLKLPMERENNSVLFTVS